MKQHNDILKEIGGNDGIAAPEGYFEDFAKKMAASLPEMPSAAAVKPTLWVRIKPYTYMAAMFAGIFCMMKMFDMMRHPSADMTIDNYPALTATLENQDVPYTIVDDFNQYEIMDDIYNEGFSADDLFLSEDSLTMSENSIEEQGNYRLPDTK